MLFVSTPQSSCAVVFCPLWFTDVVSQQICSDDVKLSALWRERHTTTVLSDKDPYVASTKPCASVIYSVTHICKTARSCHCMSNKNITPCGKSSISSRASHSLPHSRSACSKELDVSEQWWWEKQAEVHLCSPIITVLTIGPSMDLHCVSMYTQKMLFLFSL